MTDRLATSPNTRQLRSFAFIVGGGFAIIGLFPVVLRGHPPRLWALAVTTALVVAALLVPSALRPLHRMWMRLAEVLGWINTRIILLAVFYVVIVPTGALLRLFGNDILHLKFSSDADSYRMVRTKRPASHMQRQY